MKKLNYIGQILFLALVFLFSCAGPDENKQTTSVEISKSKQQIKVEYPGISFTTIDTIISRSGIQHDGYGMLLILNQSISQTQADSIRWYFQKKDVNAVHLFNISDSDTLNAVLQSAIKNSRFVWLFSNKAKGDNANRIISAIEKKAPESVLVVNR